MKMRLTAVTVTVATAAVLLTLGAAAAAPAAHASSAMASGLIQNCWTNPGDINCDNQSPVDTGCSEPGPDNTVSTVIQTNWPWGEVHLRYSSHCRTNWAQIVVYPHHPGSLIENVSRIDSVNYSSSDSIPDSSSTTYWYSPMVYAPSLSAQACATWSGSVSGEYCTPFK
jgi:hypothetical protein